MNRESLITLALDRQAGCVLVSSPQFPLLHLALPSGATHEIEDIVLPVLKEMVEFETGGQATLRLVSEFSVDAGEQALLPPPHVIAEMHAARAA